MATTNSLDAYLADEVNRVASLVPADGRFGQRKVFVAALFAALQVQSLACEGCDLADLKAFLIRANRDGRLALARADLVEAMDPGMVAHSEIRHLGAEFHFVIDSAVA
jgi:hypothetical protein